MTSEPVTLKALAARMDELLARTAASQRRFLGIDGAADYTSLSIESIRRLIAAGKLTPLRPVRGRIVIDRHELDALMVGSTAGVRGGRGVHAKQSKRGITARSGGQRPVVAGDR